MKNKCEKEYHCENCHQTFLKVVSDEEAMKECLDIWGKDPEEKYVIVCDDCFKKIMEY